MTTFGKSDGGGGGSGCRVSTPVGFVLTLLAILLAVGVGLIVHFAEKDGKEFVCRCEITNSGIGSSTGTSAQIASSMPDQCAAFVSKGDNVSHICSHCPSDQCNGQVGATTMMPETGPDSDTFVDMRLPDHVMPIHYDVELQPYMYSGNPKDFTYKGNVKITVECKKAASNITLHIDLITITQGTIGFSGVMPSSADPTFVKMETDEVRQFVILHLSGDMTVGSKYVIEMSYSGPMPDDMRGVYYSTYTRQGQTKYMLTSQFQPTDARRAFPCFDEPALKATFGITLVRPDNLISLSNMPIKDSRTTFTENGMQLVKDVYKTTPKMSTYLLAFVICDFDYTSGISDSGIKYRAFAIPESVNETQYALGVGLSLIDKYKDYFQIPYPLPKQDMIAIPDYAAGAMENWGLITYRQTAMLYKPDVSAQKNKQRVAVVVAHELAHMWFGDLVTPAWWDDLWLNEGFASYVEYLGVDMYHPDWNYLDKFVIEDTQRAMDYDGKVTSHPIVVVVNTPAEIYAIFDAISYSKGASVIRMMRYFLGESTFKQGITNYLTAMKYGAAHHDKLWESLSQQAQRDGKNIDVKSIMDTWTKQMNYPLVTLTCDPMTPGRIKAKQERYLTDPSAIDPGTYTSPYGYRWSIPVTLTSSKNSNFATTEKDVKWLMNAEDTMDIGAGLLPDCSDTSSWILGNIEAQGFYRVNYETKNWEALADQLNKDHTVIPVINRAQLINDAFNLVKSGHIELGTAMKMVHYLKKETAWVPWAAAAKELGYISKMVAIEPLHGPFENYMKTTLTDLYETYGLDNTNASYTEIDSRRIIAGEACSYGVQSCLDATSVLFKQWMDKPDNNPIDVNIKPVVYCYGIQNGGWDEWNFALQMYVKATVASEKDEILRALSCSSQAWILNNFLELIIQPNSPIRSQDISTVMKGVASSNVGRPLAWDFFRSNYDLLFSDYIPEGFSVSGTIGGITQDLKTKLDLAELEELIQSKAGKLGSGKTPFQQALERTNGNIRWRERNLPQLKAYFEQFGSGDESPSTDQSKDVDMRLPDHTTPLHYNVELQPYMYSGKPEDFSYKGNVKIILECNKASSNVTLHIDLIEVDLSTIKFYGEMPINSDPIYTDFEIDKARQFFILKLSHDMVVGQNYVVEMSYSAKMPDDLRGVYYSKYQRNGQDKYMLTTQFQPTDARRAFPCYDEPRFKATYNITLVRPDYLISLSNMPVMDNSTTIVENGITFVKDVYFTTPRISTYLLAFVICDFTYLSGMSANGVEYRAYAIPESIHQAKHALDVGVKLLKDYEDLFGIKYPLPKQDMIAIPDYSAGAMENWGLITYRETAMLWEEGVSTESDKEWVAIVVAHELAHMWFGDLVTPAWWDDLWLNEGFATFVEFLGVDLVFPEWKMFDKFVLDVQRAMAYDGQVTSHPVIVTVNTPDEINEIFDSISYQKSGSLIRMMRHFLGVDTFNKGITKYLDSLKYGAATHVELWSALTKQASDDGKNINVQDIMDTWTKQMNYPVVTVTRDPNNGANLMVKQERYLVDYTADDLGVYNSPYGYQWTIPLTLTSSKTKKFDPGYDDVIWMQKEEASKSINVGLNNLPALSDTSGWVLANIQQLGFYRVNYPVENWKALAEQLNRDHKVIPITNRAQLLDDSFNLAKSGLIGLDTALMMTSYLDKERDYIPWNSAVGEMGYIKRMLSLDSLYAPFQSFMLDKIRPSYNQYGLDNTNASHIEVYARALTAGQACSYGIQSCLDAASAQFKQWMNNPSKNPIDPDLKYTVYCNAIRNGGWAEWSFGLEMYKKEKVATEKEILFYALTCASEPWILQYYLELSIQDNSPIRFQDLAYAISYVSYGTVGRPLAWKFVRDRYSELLSIFATNQEKLAMIIGRVTRAFNTPFELAELENFLSTTALDLANTQPGTRRAVAQVKANIQWMENNKPALEKFLTDLKYINV